MATQQRSRCVRALLGVPGSLAGTVPLAVAMSLVVALVMSCSRVVEGVPVADPAAPAPGAPSSPLPSGESLRRGDCASVAGFTRVDCVRPHELEVFRVSELPAKFQDRYPTAEDLLPRLEPECRAGLADYVGSPEVDASRLREFVYWPSRQGWDAGQRWALCTVVEIGPDDRPLRRTGTLRGALRAGLGRFQACSQGPPSQGALRVVPCTEPHLGEAVPGVLSLGTPADPPVTAERANAAAEPHCRRVIDEFLTMPADRLGVRPSWRFPLAESWPNGYTTVVCYAESDTPVTGSLRDR